MEGRSKSLVCLAESKECIPSIWGLTLSRSRLLLTLLLQRFPNLQSCSGDVRGPPIHVVLLIALKMGDLSLTSSLTKMLFGTEPSTRYLAVYAPVP